MAIRSSTKKAEADFINDFPKSVKGFFKAGIEFSIDHFRAAQSIELTQVESKGAYSDMNR
jgi:hypothetical protein